MEKIKDAEIFNLLSDDAVCYLFATPDRGEQCSVSSMSFTLSAKSDTTTIHNIMLNPEKTSRRHGDS